jgi:hypothetical protein
MANVFEKVDMLGAEALMHLEDSLIITSLCSKDTTSDFNKTASGYAVGDTIRYKTRPSFEAKEFASTIDIQEIKESARPMVIEKHFDVSVDLTAKELALDFESFAEQIVQPAAYALAEKVDNYVGTKILEGAGLSVATTILSDAASMAAVRKDATYQQLSPTGRYALVTDILEARLLGATYFNTYNNRGTDGSQVFRDGSMGHAMGMDWFSSLNFPNSSTHTAGNGTSTTDNTAGTFNAVGTKTLQIDALTGTINAGDRIKIAGVRRPLIAAAQATATATSVSLVDPIAEIIPDGAAVTVIASGTTVTFQGAVFDDRSLAVAFPILDLPEDVAASTISDNGVSIRVAKGYNMQTKKTTLSLDLLVGSFALDPRRITLIGDAA